MVKGMFACGKQRANSTVDGGFARFRGIPLPNAEAEVQKRVERNSRAHYNMMLRFNSNSVVALFTEKPAIGVKMLTNVAFENPDYEIPWTLWCNSTLGLFCHWLHSGKQQGGRGLLSSLFALRTLPTLDVRGLSEEALVNAETLFEALKYNGFCPSMSVSTTPFGTNWMQVF